LSARAPSHGLALHALRFGAAALLLRAALCVHAQVAPSAAEIQSYGPLHAAALRGDLPTLAATIAGRAPLDARDGHGRTALQLARSRGFKEMVKILEGAQKR
jgi:ankyrin repeat protein